MAETISKVTAYKLKIEDMDGIEFGQYDEIKSSVYSYKGEDYPYRLFFLRQVPRPVEWYGVFADLDLDDCESPQKLNAGFIFLVQATNSFYAVTGGLAHIHLKKVLDIEHNFGIVIAEKILSLPELRGLAQKDTSGVVNALDRVFRGRYNPNGDVNNLKRVLTHIRGKLSAQNRFYEAVGKSIQASDALSVNGTKDFADIIRFLACVHEIWGYPERGLRIPQLEFINKKFYPDLLETLVEELVAAICDYSPEENSLFLDNDLIGYLPDRVTKYQLMFNRQKYDCDTYADVFGQAASILRGFDRTERVDTFQRMNLRLFFDDDHQETKEFFFFVCGDVTYDNDVFFINNKHWYKASDEFVSRLDAEIDNIEFIMPEKLHLSEWDARFANEGSYNEGQQIYVCLDRKLVRVAAERGGIEFCDLLREEGDGVFVLHVKNSCGALCARMSETVPCR